MAFHVAMCVSISRFFEKFCLKKKNHHFIEKNEKQNAGFQARQLHPSCTASCIHHVQLQACDLEVIFG